MRRVVRPDPERGIFYYPRRGYGQISEAIAAAATQAGADIRTGTEVAAIRATDARRRDRHRRRHDPQRRRLLVDPAAPTPRAHCRVHHLTIEAAAHTLETRALLLVYLALPRSQWTPYDAHYFPEADVLLSRLSEPKNYRDNPEDPRDVTVLCAEVPCSVGDDTWNAPSDALAGAVRDALDAQRPPDAPNRSTSSCARCPRAYPVYRVGYEAAFATVDEWASTLPRVLHFGRQGLFAHDNTHHALAMAWAAADAIGADGLVDERAMGRQPAPASPPTSSKTDARATSCVARQLDSGNLCALVRRTGSVWPIATRVATRRRCFLNCATTVRSTRSSGSLASSALSRKRGCRGRTASCTSLSYACRAGERS